MLGTDQPRVSREKKRQPRMECQSAAFTDAPSTRTKASFGPGTGCGTSASRSESAPPYRSHNQAFIAVSVLGLGETATDGWLSPVLRRIPNRSSGRFYALLARRMRDTWLSTPGLPVSLWPG
jgi:hypothetical protein